MLNSTSSAKTVKVPRLNKEHFKLFSYINFQLRMKRQSFFITEYGRRWLCRKLQLYYVFV